jgi:hypothetical protein
VGLQPLTGWECGFECCRRHGCFVSFEYCVLSDRGLCVGLVSRPEDSYRMLGVQWVRCHSPVRCGHDPESGRRAPQKEGILKNNLRIPIKSSWRTFLFRRQRASNKLLNPINELCVSPVSILNTLTERVSPKTIWKTCHCSMIHAHLLRKFMSLPSAYLSFKIYAVTFNEVIGVVLKCAG